MSSLESIEKSLRPKDRRKSLRKKKKRTVRRTKKPKRRKEESENLRDIESEAKGIKSKYKKKRIRSGRHGGDWFTDLNFMGL